MINYHTHMNLISVDLLRVLFGRIGYRELVTYTADYNCGQKTTIKIEKTTSGFGIVGGILYESESKIICAKCINRHKEPKSMVDFAQQAH